MNKETETLSYKTIEAPCVGEIYCDRGSKFIGYSFPVKNSNEIKSALKKVKEENTKANHFCYAWRLGTTGNAFRASDNGEPSGSAGYPILGRIDSYGLTDVLVVVVRYFGGTLLGIPGLIKAYKTAADAALKISECIVKDVCRRYNLHFDYTVMNDVMQVIRHCQAQIVRQEMALFCDEEIDVPIKNEQRFIEEIQRIKDVKIIVQTNLSSDS